MKSILELSRDMATLRGQTMQKISYLPTENSSFVAKFQEATKDKLTRSVSETGIIPECYYEGGRLKACFVPYKSIFDSGDQCFEIRIDYELGNKRAQHWCEHKISDYQLQNLSAQYPILFNLMFPYSEMLPVLKSKGIGIHSIMMIGNVKLAKSKIQKKEIPSNEEILNHGIEIIPIRNSNDVENCVNLFVNVFRSQPEYGFFVTSDNFVSKMKVGFETALEKNNGSPSHKTFILKQVKEEKVLGFFDYDFQPQNIVTGGHGSVSLCLANQIKEKKLSRVAYSILFNELENRGIERFMGATSNPAVLHSARFFERRPMAYMMKSGPCYFENSYFMNLGDE